MFWQKRFIPVVLITGWLSACGSDSPEGSEENPVVGDNTMTVPADTDNGTEPLDETDGSQENTVVDDNTVIVPADTDNGTEPLDETDGSVAPPVDLSATIDRISLGADRVELNDDSGQFAGASLARVSSDGRFVAFTTAASNAIGDDQNGFNDVYYRNRSTGEIRRISIGANGEATDNNSSLNDMTPDGRYLVFSSDATNIAPSGTSGASQVYRHDTQTGETLLVSQNSAGQAGNGPGVDAQISADGNTIVYRSFANNIIEGDTNGIADVVIFNAQTLQSTSMTVNDYLDFENRTVWHDFTADGTTILLSLGDNISSGRGITLLHNTETGELEDIEHEFGINSAFVNKYISDNGEYIVYSDRISSQIFRLNLSNSTSQLVNVSTTAGINVSPDISADGRYVSYQNITTGNIYLRDMSSEDTVQVTFGLNGTLPNDASGSAKIVGNAEFVSFSSRASNMVENDNNFKQDIFLYRTNL